LKQREEQRPLVAQTDIALQLQPVTIITYHLFNSIKIPSIDLSE